MLCFDEATIQDSFGIAVDMDGVSRPRQLKNAAVGLVEFRHALVLKQQRIEGNVTLLGSVKIERVMPQPSQEGPTTCSRRTEDILVCAEEEPKEARGPKPKLGSAVSEKKDALGYFQDQYLIDSGGHSFLGTAEQAEAKR